MRLTSGSVDYIKIKIITKIPVLLEITVKSNMEMALEVMRVEMLGLMTCLQMQPHI